MHNKQSFKINFSLSLSVKQQREIYDQTIITIYNKKINLNVTSI